jgi:hypothetical protein
MRKIIGLAGMIGSGKNTAAKHLIEKYNYVGLSFASTVKDCLAVIFHWDRTLLEGETVESREWREKVDSYWANKLKIKNFTPRFAMQYIATDLFRDKFNDSFWIHSLEKKILEMNQNIVISDCRFFNECAMLKSHGGILIRIARGPDPDWYGIARSYPSKMHELYPLVHASEYSWASIDFDHTIDNNSSLEDFLNQIDLLA